MAEAVAALGLVVNIVQLLEWGRKIVKRLDEFQKRGNKIPEVFHDIKTVLPLLLNTLSETQKQAEQQLLDDDTQKALLAVVLECRTQCGRLDEILVKTLPTASDHKWERGIKAISSVQQEKAVKSIVDTVQGYISVFTWYQVTRAGRLNLGEYLHSTRSRSPQPESRKVFLVPFERDCDYIDRVGIIGELNDRLKTHRRVSLAGIGGVGYLPTLRFNFIYGLTKYGLENLRSLSNIATGFVRTILQPMCSGSTLLPSPSLIKATER